MKNRNPVKQQPATKTGDEEWSVHVEVADIDLMDDRCVFVAGSQSDCGGRDRLARPERRVRQSEAGAVV
jgi:hypothetical protein